MKIRFESVGDFTNITKWLSKMSKNTPTKVMEQAAKDGVQSLKSNTPIGATGQTAAGWTSKLETKRKVTELSFINNAHPEASVNIAKIIDTGHGTRHGGYVAPRPYIIRSMEPVFRRASDKIEEEMID